MTSRGEMSGLTLIAGREIQLSGVKKKQDYCGWQQHCLCGALLLGPNSEPLPTHRLSIQVDMLLLQDFRHKCTKMPTFELVHDNCIDVFITFLHLPINFEICWYVGPLKLVFSKIKHKNVKNLLIMHFCSLSYHCHQLLNAFYAL